MTLEILIIIFLCVINCIVVNSLNGLSTESSLFVSNIRKYDSNRNKHTYHHLKMSNSNDFSKSQQQQPSQILSFIEPLSGVTVIIIGSMHYNPQSIQLAEQTIEQSALKNQLGAVVIESCNTRWRKMVASTSASSSTINSKHGILQNSTSILSNSNTTSTAVTTTETLTSSSSSSPLFMNKLRRLLKNEMKASHDMANKYSIPTVLGDQDINQTGLKAKEIVSRTFHDLIKPLNGGWQRIYRDIVSDFQSSYPSESNSLRRNSGDYIYNTATTAAGATNTHSIVPSTITSTTNDNNNNDNNNSYLSMLDILLDYKLLLGTPKALVSYMTALILKSPLVGVFFLLLLFLSAGFDDSSSAASSISNIIMDISNSGGSSGSGSKTEVVMNWSSYLALLTNPLLLSDYMDKSLYSSMDIMDSSVLSQLVVDFLGSFVFTALEIVFFSRIFLSALLTDRNQVLAENIRNTCLYLAAAGNGNVNGSNKDKDTKEVIVVLGMAHCNGVRYLLENPSNSYSTTSHKDTSSVKDISELSKQIESIIIKPGAKTAKPS